MLAEFERPPLVEVAASVQFPELGAFHVAHLGALWLEFRDQYPTVQQHHPLDQVVEQFDRPRRARSGLTVTSAMPVPRLWFVNESGAQIVQVQSDRLVVNWKRVRGADAYPRYEGIKSEFERVFGIATSFFEAHNLDAPQPSQVELTYVNALVSDNGDAGTKDWLHKVLTNWADGSSDATDVELEEVTLRSQSVLMVSGAPAGRLYVDVSPGVAAVDGKKTYMLSLTVRGAPKSPTLAGATEFLDFAHRVVIDAFLRVTTEAAHFSWGRQS